MFTIDYKGMQVPVLFLEAAVLLNDSDRNNIAHDVLKCHFEKFNKVDSKGDEYIGQIKATGKYGIIGEYGGKIYDVEFDCMKSSLTQKASLLVGKYQNSRMN